MAAGRALITASGGLLPLSSVPADAGASLDPQATEVCNQVLVGQQAPGQPCLWNFECAPSGGVNAQCVAHGGADCLGTCVLQAGSGQECQTHGHPDCQTGLTCLRPGEGTTGVCVNDTVGANQACEVDGGSLDCENGLVCMGGTCAPALSEGTGCGESSECASGLVCAGLPSRCTARLSEGAVCADADGGVSVPCAQCLWCVQWPPATAGAATCTSLAAEGEACTARPCQIGLPCVGGVCVHPVGPGQACTQADHDTSNNGRGTCLRADQACFGSPATCQMRVAQGQGCVVVTDSAERASGNCQGGLICERAAGMLTGTCVPEEAEQGQPCTVDEASTRSEQGNCVYPLRCLRANAQTLSGTCARRAHPGEPCGDTPSTPSSCEGVVPAGQDAGSRYASCSEFGEGVQGFCYENDGPSGSACRSDFNCEDGLYCDGFDGGVVAGTCLTGGANDALCDSSQPWGRTCQTGLYCKYLGSAGNSEYHCTPYAALNAACTSNTACGLNARCLNQTCQPLGAANAPCSFDSDCQEAFRCEADVCVLRAARGEACESTSDCQEGLNCRSNVCVGNVPEGGACTYSSDCLDGLSCQDNVCVNGACAEQASESCAENVPFLLLFGTVAPFVRWSRRRRKC